MGVRCSCRAHTTCIKHLAVSGLSHFSARIKSSCNLTGNRFELPNVSYTQPLATSGNKTTARLTFHDSLTRQGWTENEICRHSN